MLTHGVHEGRMERLVQVCCENPARIYGLFPRKGAVAVGSDADLVVVDLSREVTVGPEHLNTQAGWSIMEGKTYHGWPVLPCWVAGSPPNGPTTRPGRARWASRGRYLPRAVRPEVPQGARDRLVRTGPDGTWPASGRGSETKEARAWRSGTTFSETPTARSSRPPDGAGRPGSEPDRCCW